MIHTFSERKGERIRRGEIMKEFSLTVVNNE
jgi:hypothetical protein